MKYGEKPSWRRRAGREHCATAERYPALLSKGVIVCPLYLVEGRDFDENRKLFFRLFNEEESWERASDFWF